MWRKDRIIGIGTALLVGVLGVTAAVSENAAPPRLRGTLDQVSGNVASGLLCESHKLSCRAWTSACGTEQISRDVRYLVASLIGR
jgi:hypothetical protein